MNLREWLFIAGVVIILGILIDGIRRMRLAKQDSLKMSRDLGGHINSSPLDDDFNPELPGEGVRVIRSVDGEDSTADESAGDAEFKAAVEPPLHDNLTLTANGENPKDRGDVDSKNDKIKVEPSLGFELTADSHDSVGGAEEGLVSPARVIKAKRKANNSASSVEPQSKKASSSSAPPQQEHEVIVINVDAPSGKAFSGAAIKNLLEACGMKHGDMSIFHRHEEDDLLSPIQFSVANAVEPGYFDPDKLDTIQTAGVSFFMSIPGPKDYLKAFEFMNETARCFAENLHGDLKDENRSVLTAQTIEHCRHRIREFERKQLCKIR